MMRQILMVCAAGIVVGGVLAAAPPPAPRVAALKLDATPVPLNPEDPAQQRVGRLRYLGGVVLRSPDAAFGGLSGLRARGDWLLAVSDTGNWVAWRTIEVRGRLVGVTGGRIAPLLDEAGRPAAAKELGDAEALTWAADGSVAVSFEQDHRIQLYAGIDPTTPASLGAHATRTLRYAATGGWLDNGGGEALVALSDGGTLWFQEEGQDADGWSPVLRLAASGTVETLRYRPPAGYRPTDAIELSPGEVLVLNRRFTPTEGVSAVLTTASVAPNMAAVEVARLSTPLTVDNFEGLTLRREGRRTFVYLVSDDNFLGLQRTLLLKFELLAATSPKTSIQAQR